MYLLYKPLISQRYVLCNCLEILHTCLHVSRTIWFTFLSDRGSFKSKRSWEITTRYYCIRVRLVLAQVLGEPWRGLILKHAISFLDLQFIFFSLFPQNLKKKPRYLITFTVGYKQRQNIDACVKMAVLFVFFSKFLFLF